MNGLPPGAMLRSQPKLPLRDMSGSLAMQGQGSMSVPHITTREHSDFPGWDTWMSRGCAEQESWPHLSPVAAVEKAASVPCPGNIVELVGGMWLSWPEGVCV